MNTKTYSIRELNWPEKIFLTKRATVAFDKLQAFFGEAYGEIYNALKGLKIQATEPPCAFYYKIDESNMETDLAAAVPVSLQLAVINGLQSVVIPPSKVITTTHYGSYDNMIPAYKELEDYLAENNLEKTLIVEEYLSDPELEKDPAKWKTNIYFVLKQ